MIMKIAIAHHGTTTGEPVEGLARSYYNQLPIVRAASQDTIIAAAGTSCRQQIVEGTGRQAIYPIIVMARAVAE